jgi:Tfp pilus assembly protein PilV
MGNLNKKIKGMTIVEMLMAIAIFTIGIIGFTFLFFRTWQANSYVLETGQSSMAASQGMNKIINYIRKSKQADDGAYPIKSANGNDFIFYSDYDKDGITERLHIYKSGRDILMGATKPTETLPKTYPSGDQETIAIVSGVLNEVDEPIFYYYNRDYPADEINNPMAIPVTNYLADIRLIKVYFEINANPNKSLDNVKIQSFVELRNLNDYDRLQ